MEKSYHHHHHRRRRRSFSNPVRTEFKVAEMLPHLTCLFFVPSF
jgi:hypothetical protein